MEFQLFLPFYCNSIMFFVLQSQLISFSYAGQHLCAPDDAAYLLQFKQKMPTPDITSSYYLCDSGSQVKTLSWNVTVDCCNWDGVTCNEFTGHVIGLDLSCSFLRGTINANSSLTKLGHLQKLNLAFNWLDGFPLGNGISKLTRLTHLNLSSSGYYEGEMIPPGLSELYKLVSLDLSQNAFPIDPTTFRSLLQNLTNLEVLSLNQLRSTPHTSLELPKNLSSSLRYLSLEYTNLLGDISKFQLFHLPNLQVLRLRGNSELTGILPNFTWSFSTSILELDFSETRIFGKIPDSIGNLHSLRYLGLSNCNLSGQIPEPIGNLSRIREFHLSNNNFTGNVPSTISKLNQLSSLDFSDNNFEGLIPDIFSNFSELTSLNFSSNNFTGSFPYSVANLTRLTGLFLQNNFLTGPLPSGVSGLQKLDILDLSSNLLTGTAPPWLFVLPSLTDLKVSTNQLSGKLPNVLKSHQFESVDLSHNKLYGEIPDWLTSMKLEYLDLSYNYFTGFEKQVWGSTDLGYLNLENNFLQGSLHKSICDMINLEVLDLAHNNFSGKIPGCLGNLSSFFIVDLRMNNFHGEIPRFSATGLQYLGLADNQLGGQVPRSLVNCTRLEALDLGNNKINDTFPIWLEKLPSLQVLILKSNLFHGSIGDLKSEFSFHVLRIFDLSFNGFTRTLPPNIFRNFRGMMEVDEGKTGISYINGSNYSYDVSLMIKGNEFVIKITLTMKSIDLSSNRFEGEIPHSIGSLHSLVLLNLSHNSFHGCIPGEIAKMNELEAVDLSWNKLIGEIPDVLSNLHFLEVLNLSYNHLVGRIPLGKQFNTFSNESYRGNPDLCGLPLSKECGTKNVSHESPFEQDHDDSFFAGGFTWESVVIGYSCCMSFGLFLILLLEKPKWIVKHVDEIAQKIAEEIALKKRRQRKRRQR